MITDYTMPHLTGTDLAKELLKIQPDMRVILCTAFNERVTLEIDLKAGIAEHVIKPVEKMRLAELVRQVPDLKGD